jgi:hypothetical protein
MVAPGAVRVTVQFDAFQCFVMEGEHEMASPAPLAFIEAFMSAVHFHQLGDPG